jgi:hypothetical protein
MTSHERKGSTTVKIAVPDDLLPRITLAAKSAAQPRSHWLLEAAQQRLSNGSAMLDRASYPKAVQGVLKATNGKLSRLEAEHAVALVINAMAKDNNDN